MAKYLPLKEYMKCWHSLILPCWSPPGPKGLCLYNGRNFVPWENEANEFLIANEVYCGTQLNNTTFVFGTVRGGIVVIDKQGSLIQVLNKQAGLLDNLIFDLFVDKDQNLWVGQTNGISYVAFDSPFKLIDERVQLEGQGFTSIVFNHYNWFGTLRNLYRMPAQVSSTSAAEINIEPMHGSNSSTMNLMIAGNVLLAAQTTGVIAIDENDRVEPLIKNKICLSLLQLDSYPEYTLVGTNNGMVLLEDNRPPHSTSAKWQFKSEISGFGESVFYIAEGEPGEIWIGDEQKGIYRLQLNQSLDSVISTVLYDSKSGLPADINNRLYTLEGQPIITTEQGLYQYDRDLDSMIVSPGFDDILGNRYVHSLTQDKQGGLWLWAASEPIDNRREMEVVRLIKDKGEYTMETGMYRQLNELYRSFYPEVISFDDQHVLFVKPSGFISHRLDSPLGKGKHIPMLIREVATDSSFDSLVYVGHLADEWGIPEASSAPPESSMFSYELRNLRFKWSALSYTHPEKTQYSFQLENFDQGWSEWANTTQKEYTNLQYGKYQLKVRARNTLGQNSDTAVYSFEIMRPWYLTYQAFAGYLVAAVFFIYGIVRINVNRLVRQKEALEKVVRNRTREIRLQKTEIEIEKKKSDELLLNILPSETAEELKIHGNTKPRHYESASVMFTDFCDFTSISRTMAPDQLVALIDHYFTGFDQVISKFQIEKIKTIGDSFMCASGVPRVNPEHAIDIIKAALEIKLFVQEEKLKRKNQDEPYFEIRIGISSGPLIAGVVGSKKYAYDIWGATVNLASRVESSGLADKVMISNATYELVKDHFECEYFGKTEAKNIGLIDTYLVKAARTIHTQ